jgi:hypothetical protein
MIQRWSRAATLVKGGRSDVFRIESDLDIEAAKYVWRVLVLQQYPGYARTECTYPRGINGLTIAGTRKVVNRESEARSKVATGNWEGAQDATCTLDAVARRVELADLACERESCLPRSTRLKLSLRNNGTFSFSFCEVGEEGGTHQSILPAFAVSDPFALQIGVARDNGLISKTFAPTPATSIEKARSSTEES